MGLVEKVQGKLVGVDTSIFIYFIEKKNPAYIQIMREFFKKNKEGKIRLVTSTITLLEVLVQPFKQSRYDLVEKYKKILEESEYIKLVDFNTEISEISAKIRAKSGIRTPDAIQIGTSVHSEADYFLTNDKRLKSVEEIPLILLDDFV
jgi:predicted nucleic acid-binding protein